MKLCVVLRSAWLVLTMTRDPKWIADSGASFHMTHSADLLGDVRLGDDKVRVGDNHLIDVAWGTEH